MVYQRGINHSQDHIDERQRKIQKVAPQQPAHKERGGLALFFWLLVLLSFGVIGLESFGVTNVIPTFGTGGRPKVTLGLWHFTDISSDLWAKPFINGLTQKGVISGYSDDSFQPNQAITRAEFAAMLNAAFSESALQPQNISFNDLSPKFWGSSGIAKATQKGFFAGYPQGRFRPDQPLSKVNALVALASGLGLKTEKLTTKTNDQILSIYKDADQIPVYARDSTAAATAAGLVVRESPTVQLNPNQPITRAEAAASIYQALVHLGKAEAIASPYFVN